jgi:iron-sulfur cluster repair protein YtfE (RIC family)
MTETITHAPEQPIDLYREVHKGLRLALFDLVRTAGSLDVSDPSSIVEFQRLFDDIEMMLIIHHGHESSGQLGGLIADHAAAHGQTIDDGHEESTRRLAELHELVDALPAGPGDAVEIYDLVAAFTADYLQHMILEESLVMPALRAGVAPDDLMALVMEIRTSVPPPDMCVFLRYMLPAMNPDERTSTLLGMKLGAPPEIFDMFWNVAEKSLPSAAVAEIAERLAA